MHEVNLFNIKYCLISLSGTRFYFLRFSNEISRNVNKNIAANVYRGSWVARSNAPIFLLSLIPELYPCQHIVQHHPSATMMIMCDNMRLCLLFILCYLEFTFSFHRGLHRGSRLHQISDGFSNKSKFELNDGAPFWQEPFSSLFANAIPFAAAVYILQAQDKNLKEAFSNLEKTLASQDKNQKDTLATQDKNQRESLSNLEKTLATQDKIWNIRFENFVSAIEKMSK